MALWEVMVHETYGCNKDIAMQDLIAQRDETGIVDTYIDQKGLVQFNRTGNTTLETIGKYATRHPQSIQSTYIALGGKRDATLIDAIVVYDIINGCHLGTSGVKDI